MGNPWVFLAVPIPLPVETHTCAKGTGIFAGQIIIPEGIPVPVPMAGDPWVHNKLVGKFIGLQKLQKNIF